MRLIMKYNWGNEYDGSGETVIPIEYESAEALLVNFMDAAKIAYEKKEDFIFLSREFSSGDFFYQVEKNSKTSKIKYDILESPPEIMTIDEFFEDALK